MPFMFSRCIFLQLPDPGPAVEFYHKTMGMEVLRQDGQAAELKAGPFRLIIGPGEPLGPVMEFLVPEAESAKDELVRAGCQVVSWKPEEGVCLMRDPFGYLFSLFPAPDAFFE